MNLSLLLFVCVAIKATKDRKFATPEGVRLRDLVQDKVEPAPRKDRLPQLNRADKRLPFSLRVNDFFKPYFLLFEQSSITYNTICQFNDGQ